MSKWYLSFDCATKSLAFCLLAINFQKISKKESILLSAQTAADNYIKALQENNKEETEKWALTFAKLRIEARESVRFVAGQVKDLFPGRPDKSIKTIERVRAVKKFVKNCVIPVINAASQEGCPSTSAPELNVVIEFQFGANAKSRLVKYVLITIFSECNVFIVGPSLKNKVWFPEDIKSKQCFFLEKYAKPYGANKAHALYCFEHLEKLFKWDVPTLDSPQFKKDLADSCMQVIGFLKYGKQENAHMAF